MSQVWQWKKLSKPPSRQRPQKSQWNWPLSSSSNKQHFWQKYWPKLMWQFEQFWAISVWENWQILHIKTSTSWGLALWFEVSLWHCRHSKTFWQHFTWKKELKLNFAFAEESLSYLYFAMSLVMCTYLLHLDPNFVWKQVQLQLSVLPLKTRNSFQCHSNRVQAFFWKKRAF